MDTHYNHNINQPDKGLPHSASDAGVAGGIAIIVLLIAASFLLTLAYKQLFLVFIKLLINLF
jgi:hypothetical protein